MVLVDPAIRSEGEELLTQYLRVTAADLASVREPGLQSLAASRKADAADGYFAIALRGQADNVSPVSD